MNETYQQVEDFLNNLFVHANFSLVGRAMPSAHGCLFDIDGNDADFLHQEGGELLNALEHLVNQAFSRELDPGERLVCDVHGFRATRELELRVMARHAAEHVRSTNTSFSFGSMDANERRIIHLSLAEEQDIQTESIGEGYARYLKVSSKLSKK